jgi:WD40 repeat protein
VTASWKTVRVFVSSTFRDMQAERDHLVRFVFPRLREELLQRRVHLVDVDLRWGVTCEQDASAVCREVVDECRPRFLCMLGGRYGWIPPGKDRSITAEEVQYGVLDRIGQHGHAFFYFRDPDATAAMVEKQAGEFREPPRSANEHKLTQLKEAIGRHGLKPFIYPADWDRQHGRLVGLTKFGLRVYTDLLASIDAEFGTGSPAKLDEFAEENAAMEAFIEERTERFALGSRESVWNELLLHASGDGDNGYLCLVGKPGFGKSALVARFFQYLSGATLGNPQPANTNPKLVIGHFVGASPGSTNVRRTLRRLCHELVEGAGFVAEIPDDPEKLRAAFPEILKRACAKMRVVLLIDAVNQFDLGSSDLSWLPEKLPDNARIIVTTLAGPALDGLRRRNLPPREVTLPPLLPNDVDAIIEEFLHRYRKSMTSEQHAMLRAKAEAITPLYLLAALEELRTLGRYEEITDRIRELPGTTQRLFGWILKRLEKDPGFCNAEGRLVGANLVSGFSGYLAASQHGLSQSELVDLLDRSDPQGNVAALLQLLRPYLMRRGELLDFYHGQFRTAAEQAYLPTDAQRCAAHLGLADYFRGQADPGMDQRWRGVSARPFLELPFHLARSDPRRLHELLWNPRWYRAKLKHTDSYGLILDLEMIPEDLDLLLVRDAISLSAHVLARDTAQLATQLVGRLMLREEPNIRSLIQRIDKNQDDPWLRPQAPTLSSVGGPLLRTLEGHTAVVKAVAVAADGKAVSGGYDNALKVWDLASGTLLRTLTGHSLEIQRIAVTADGKIVSASSDHTLKVWDLVSGTLLRTLEGHTHWVHAVAVTGDGRAISGSADKTLKVWNIASGQLLRTLEGHSKAIKAVALTADGKAVSASDDNTLKLWDLASGKLLRSLEDRDGVTAVAVTADGMVVCAGNICSHTIKVYDLPSGALLCALQGQEWVNAVAVTADGKVVSASKHNTIGVWDLPSRKFLRTLEGHSESVNDVAVTTDGKAVSASGDKTLKVWDLASGAIRPTVQSHTGAVTAVAVTTDNKAISASTDHTLKVWDLSSASVIRTLEGHKSMVWDVAVTTDGKVISASADHNLKIWDWSSGTLLRTLEGHRSEVHAVAVTADGRVVSGSQDKTLKVWDLASGQLLHDLDAHSTGVDTVAVTHDGKAVSGSSSHDRTLKVWDLTSGKLLRNLEGRYISALALSASADGKEVWALDGRRPKVWDVASGRLLRSLNEHPNRGLDLDLMADGRAVLVFDDDTLKVWDLTSDQLVASFSGESVLRSCAVAPDGRTIVAGDAVGHMHFLRLEGL